jgi:acyl-CoA thioester hydrolase
MVVYDMATKEPVAIPQAYKDAICKFEGKTLEELAKK